MGCGSCGGARKKTAQSGSVPKPGTRYSWVLVEVDGTTTSFGTEIEARAAKAAAGGTGNLVRVKN